MYWTIFILFLLSIWIGCFCYVLTLWIVLRMFGANGRWVKYIIYWLVFPPLFLKELKINWLIKLYIAFFSPALWLTVFFSYEGINLCIGNPLPITCSNIKSFVDKESDVEIPEFTISNWKPELGGFLVGNGDGYTIKFKDKIPDETYEKLEKSTLWEKETSEMGTTYALKVYDLNGEQIRRLTTFAISKDLNIGVYTYRRDFYSNFVGY